MNQTEYKDLVQKAQKEWVDLWEMTRELIHRWYEIEGYKDFQRSYNEGVTTNVVQQKQSAIQKAWELIKNMAWGALDSVTWLPKFVFKWVTEWAAAITEKLGNEKLAEKMRTASNTIADTNIGQDKSSIAYQATKGIADIAQTARLWGMLWSATGVTLPAGWSIYKQAVVGAIWGARDAYIYDLVANSELATSGEVKLSAIVGWALPIVWKIISAGGSKLYQSAFRGVKKSLDEESIAKYWYRAGKLIEDESLSSYTIGGLKKETGTNLQNTRKLLLDKADNTKPVPISELKLSMKSDIAKRLTDWLPDSANKEAIISNVGEIVDFYIWDWVSLQGKEAVSLIKNMNSQIPDSLFKKSANVLDPNKTSTVIRQMKDGLQKYLEKEDKYITKLYWDYSRGKLIEEVLDNIEVKKALWREIIWAVAWGSLYGRQDIKEGNIGEWLAKAFVWAIIGWAVLRVTGNPDVLARWGKLLKQWGQNIEKGRKLLQPILSQDNSNDQGYNPSNQQ